MDGRASHKRNTSGLAAYNRKKAQNAHKRAEDAIDRLQEFGQVVNFHTVAAAASVTASYLYRQKDLREHIEAIRQLQGRERLVLVSIEHHHKSRTEKSKDILLAAKDRKLREVEAENKHLRQELKVLLGKYYEKS